MAKYLNQSLNTSIYNGYLFYEADHHYWRALNKGNTWSENINWLVPLSTTKKLIQEKNLSIKVEVVGHPSIDNVLSNANFEVDDNQQILIKNKRQQLTINDTQSLLFISGSKDLAKDKLLLEALFQALEKTSNPKLELRLGIHPGIDNPNEYVSEILKSLEKFPLVNQQLKLLLKPSVASKIKQIEHKAYVITTEMSGDEVANLADSVASTPPATLVSMAALQGKPVYYHEKEKLAYIQTIASDSAECDQKKRLFAGDKEISLFFKAIEKKTLPKPITLLALGLKQPFVEAVCEKFMKSCHSSKA